MRWMDTTRRAMNVYVWCGRSPTQDDNCMEDDAIDPDLASYMCNGDGGGRGGCGEEDEDDVR